MNIKRWLLGSLAVFVALTVMEYVVHTLILKTVYEQTSQLWRRPEMQKAMIGWRGLGYALFALLLGFLYTRSQMHKGVIGDGLRYGFYLGLLAFIPFNLMQYTLLPLPANLVLAWMIFGVIESLLCGLIFSLCYRGTIIAPA
ncbi:MAG: hypothetical protein ONB44_14840 [candidate division KSB1 bacterium]|nr:hypothetical protein [candidate division KSB1 bacterium]MDZ7303404.1 hypothetical protein [candidate division KSB1 bacterium]MDZ7312278.1 hypothetical protein [candidate division KSB1 bacterium]